MNTTRIAVVVTVLCLGIVANASAQSGQQTRRMADPLDPLGRQLQTLNPSQVRADCRMSDGRIGPCPTSAVSTSRSAATSVSYADYLKQDSQYLADYARYQQQIREANNSHNWASVLQNVSDTLTVANQAVDLYQHARGTNAPSQ